jgi:hypothetical protein
MRKFIDGIKSLVSDTEEYDAAHHGVELFARGFRSVGLVANVTLESGSKTEGRWTIDFKDCPIRISLGWAAAGNSTEPAEVRFPFHQSSYLVKDGRLRRLGHRLVIRSTYQKSIPLVGQAVAFRWSGHDANLGLLARLAQDDSLSALFGGKRTLMRGGIPLKITIDRKSSSWRWDVFGWKPPSDELWAGYLTIARHLLEPR